MQPNRLLEPTPQSSNVAGVAYFPDQALLLVQFRNGSLYAWPDTAPETAARLAAAQSLGQFIGTLPAGLKLATVAKAGPPAEGSPLEFLPEEAGPCCRRAINGRKNSADTTVECSGCGATWHVIPDLVGGTFGWAYVPDFAVVRRK